MKQSKTFFGKVIETIRSFVGPSEKELYLDSEIKRLTDELFRVNQFLLIQKTINNSYQTILTNVLSTIEHHNEALNDLNHVSAEIICELSGVPLTQSTFLVEEDIDIVKDKLDNIVEIVKKEDKDKLN